MTDEPILLDLVALLRSLPEHGLERGDVGTIVEVHAPGAYEVEFVRADGSWRALLPLTRADCLPIHLSSEPPAVSGLVDNTLWYWYDPAADILELRLQSRRSIRGVPELSSDGFTILRDPQTSQAVGLIINGYWKRFGTGLAFPPKPDLEGGIRKVSAHLMAA